MLAAQVAFLAHLIAQCTGAGPGKRPFNSLPALQEPYPVPKCPAGLISCGHYCDTSNSRRRFYNACVDPKKLYPLLSVPKDGIVRQYADCPMQYMCIWHGKSRGRLSIWDPRYNPPETSPRIDCVTAKVHKHRVAMAKEAAASGNTGQISNQEAKRRKQAHETQSVAGSSNAQTHADDSASISGTHAVHLVPVAGSPGVHAEVTDIIEEFGYDLVDADITATILDEIESHAEQDRDERAVRSIEGFLNGEQVCTTAVESDDIPAGVCVPTRTVDVHPHDRIEFRVVLDGLPSVDEELLWDALGHASGKTP